jgi:hypothetical protein
MGPVLLGPRRANRKLRIPSRPLACLHLLVNITPWNKANPKLVNYASEERLAREMLNAKVFTQRVHYAAQLQDTWLQMESLIEHFLKTDKSQAIETIRPARWEEASISSIGTSPEEHLEMPPDACSCSSQFRDRTLADGAAALLATHGKLHGTRIEHLLKEA